MSEKRSLAFQRSAVEHLIALCPDAPETIIDAAKQAFLSLGWFERHADLTRELVRLEKAAPELAVLLRQVPSAQFSVLRFFDQQPEDTTC